MIDGIILIMIIVASLAVVATIISVFIYNKNVKKQLIQLSDALEAHIGSKPIQPFSEMEDVLLSKIQKQLLSMDDLWTERYTYEKKEKRTPF